MLRPEEWDVLTSTIASADYEDSWEALYRTTAFFKKPSIDVADDLGYVYLYDLDKLVSNYIEKIR